MEGAASLQASIEHDKLATGRHYVVTSVLCYKLELINNRQDRKEDDKQEIRGMFERSS